MIKEIIVDNTKYYFNGNTFNITKNYDIKNDTIVEKEKTSNFIRKIVINISNNCNLKCKYCYASHGNYKSSSRLMSKNSADKIIKFIAKKKPIGINRLVLFGGEPFLNTKIFNYIISELSKICIIYRIETATNGTILNEEVKEIINEYRPFITVSLDSTQKINDSLRGEGTFKKVINFIDYLKSLNYEDFEVACTYTHLHELEGMNKKKLEDFFTKLDVKFKINDVFTDDKKLKLTEELKISDQKQDIRNSLSTIIQNGNNFNINPVLYDVLISMIFKDYNEKFCEDINPNNSYSFDVNADLRDCFRFYGNNEPADIEYVNDKNNFKECRECWCKGICMQCVADIVEGYSSVYDKNLNFKKCEKKELIQYSIEEIVRISKNSKKLKALVNNFARFIRYA